MKKIITIGRQFDSLGGAVAENLSRLSGISYFDKEALIGRAEEHGISRDTFEKADEQATGSFLYSLAMSSYSGTGVHFGSGEMLITDRVFAIQTQEIKKIASDGSCILLGRCADHILSECDGLLKVFIHAPLEQRISNYMARTGETNVQIARKVIQKADKKRASYYSFYTGKNWGDPKNYHLCIDSSLLGAKGTAELINDLISKM